MLKLENTYCLLEVCEFLETAPLEFHAQRGIVALLFVHPQEVESMKKMKK
jgi:hypothetical protein